MEKVSVICCDLDEEGPTPGNSWLPSPGALYMLTPTAIYEIYEGVTSPVLRVRNKTVAHWGGWSQEKWKRIRGHGEDKNISQIKAYVQSTAPDFCLSNEALHHAELRSLML